MCGLFGFYHYDKNPIRNLSQFTNLLAKNAAVRGTDATGIAYNGKKGLTIQKEGKSAYALRFRHPDDVVCVMGHTRNATQGDKRKNFNNHPFWGSCAGLRFALAHNGILFCEKEWKKRYHLPKTKIETDSYIAVQLLEKQKKLNADSLRFMAEAVEGSFSFSLLDEKDTLWLIRGDSPLSLVHFPKRRLYVYASTDEILYKAIVDSELLGELKRGDLAEKTVCPGDILRITPDGEIQKSQFSYAVYHDFRMYGRTAESSYLGDLKAVAACQGYSPEEIDTLLHEGYTPEEIEEYLYCCDFIV